MNQSINRSINRREFTRQAVCGTLAVSLARSANAFAGNTSENASGNPSVTDAEMLSVYKEVRTPYKYGIVMPQENGNMTDSPNLFRKNGVWYMVYLWMNKNIGYEARLAKSTDLLHWKTLGTTLPFKTTGWDAWQASPSVALVDHRWAGTAEIQPYQDRYWFTYIGGAGKGYEPDPLLIGAAWTDDPTSPRPWTRYPDPIMGPHDPDARPFEKTTLYKTNVIWDRDKTLGAPFIVFYNAKNIENGKSVERIGTAISDDMIHWRRYGAGPIIDNGSGISGDPQVVRMGNLWVMFYFGAFWKPKAFDTFACSKDLVHWRKWEGDHLVAPGESWDRQYAHKPWVVKYEGVVYHFYNAVGDQGRCIALATSRPLR